jgi:glycosyltransferase involved in cell wall biosynthesis
MHAELLAGSAPQRVHTLFFVESTDLTAGPARQLYRLARGWRARGWSSAIAAVRGDGPTSRPELESLGLPVFRLTHGGRDVLKSFRLDVAWAVRALARRLAPELVFTMESLVDYPVRLGLAGTRTPIVTYLAIGQWSWERRPFRAWLLRALTSERSAVIGNSRRCLEGWSRVLGPAKLARLATARIPNPMDPSEVRARLGREHAERLTLGALGRLHPQKGFDILLEAMARLPAEVGGKRVELRLQGRGEAESDLRAQAARLGLAGRVEFRPFSSDIESFLHDLDVLVVPSRWAGLENVALEGMLAGTPTLCSSCTGLEELQLPVGMRLFDPEPGALAAALEPLLRASAREREELARSQRGWVEHEFDLVRIAGRFEDFLQRSGRLGALSAQAQARG